MGKTQPQQVFQTTQFKNDPNPSNRGAIEHENELNYQQQNLKLKNPRESIESAGLESYSVKSLKNVNIKSKPTLGKKVQHSDQMTISLASSRKYRNPSITNISSAVALQAVNHPISMLNNSQSSLVKNEKEAKPKRKNSRNKSQSSNKSHMLVGNNIDRQNSSLDSFKNALRKNDRDTIFPIGIMQDKIINNRKSQPRRKKSKQH